MIDQATTDPTRLRVLPLTAAAFVLLLFPMLAYHAPTLVELPTGGIDPSWGQAGVHAFLNGRSFAHDYVWTTGPYSFFYHRFFAGDATLLAVAAACVTAAYSAACLALLVIREDGRSLVAASAVVLLASIGTGLMHRDAVFLLVPFLVAALELSTRRSTPLLVAGVLIAGILTLAKFSIAPISVGAFVLVDVVRVTQRRWPIAIVLYLLTIAVGFVASGQAAQDLLPFIVNSIEVTRGFAAAMSYPGSDVELVLWLVAASIVVLATAVGEIIAVRRGASPLITSLARVALVAGFLLVIMKAGFVRHDLHSLIAWCGVFFAALALAGPATHALYLRWRAITLLVLAGLIGQAGIVFFAAHYGTVLQAYQAGAPAGIRELQALASIAPRPFDWIADLDVEVKATRRRLYEESGLPRLAGSIDAIPNMQATLIAAEAVDPAMTYLGRPGVQEYAVYTPDLIALDRAFFEGPSAPDYLLLAPGTIDGRHPASPEGALWPLFLSRYEVHENLGDLLVLRRRAEAIRVAEAEASTLEFPFGEEIPIPADPRPVFLRLEIEYALAGKILEMLYRPPFVRMIVTYADGTAEDYRIVPGMISEGMIIAPTLRTASDYGSLTEPGAGQQLPRPVSFRLYSTLAWAVSPVVRGTMSALEIGSAGS